MNLEYLPNCEPSIGVCWACSGDARKLVGRPTGITLRVENIVGLCDRLKLAGVVFIKPLEMSASGWMAIVADQDGNQIALEEQNI